MDEENTMKGNTSPEEGLHSVASISGLYETWFLDYASYVILDRAVPHIFDGLKPVQRRILHSLREMDDGRYNKVANVIGNASIGDAMVQLGQKDLLIDMQGNWGNPITGDAAAAPRYIEGRLTKFAQEVIFNPETTEWVSSYDGRNREPLILPVKFPLVLSQGADGIAVGLATKILPHNFIELLEASIEILKGNDPDIYPDFLTGGIADFSKYNEGRRGGRVRVRAKIQERDKKTLIITEVPFSTTTTSLIESIVSANDKGKIKVRKIEDNTADKVEILVHLLPGTSPDITIDALYAFTECEVSISPNTCVIKEDKPHFLSVKEILRESTLHTKDLLKRELEIYLGQLQEKWHYSSLEKIFIENRIYRDIEECTTFEAVIKAIDEGLKPFIKGLRREVTREDILRLTEIKIKRISKYDAFKADEALLALEKEIGITQDRLAHLNTFAIEYFQSLIKKYGKGKERRTEIRTFDTILATEVALANTKVYVNRDDGFFGTGLKKDEYVFDCSDLDDIICFRKDGHFSVNKVSDKTFVGKDIIHIAVFKRNDERTIYHMIYSDGPFGTSYIKRFAITGITREKEYDLTKGTKGSRVWYFSANPNGESEVVTVYLKPQTRIRKLIWDQDFAELEIKGRSSQGNIVSKFPLKKIVQKSKGVSTLGGRKLWYDLILHRLNTEGRGTYLGSFSGEDKIVGIRENGSLEIRPTDLSQHFDSSFVLLKKWKEDTVFSLIQYDGNSENYYVKRFKLEIPLPTKVLSLISDHAQSRLILVTDGEDPVIEMTLSRGKAKVEETQRVSLKDLIEIKGLKALGNRLSPHNIIKCSLMEGSGSENSTGDETREKELDSAASNRHSEPEPLVKDKLDLEILNPDDIDLNPGGQLDLF
jgi:topoisomerase-4 subunit A